jgi:acetyltransferase-like isoleucine patch superfamily enzyme
MKKYINNLYKKIARHIYIVGKIEYDKYWGMMMLKKVTAGNGTKFTSEANIINLANDSDRIQIGKNCHIAGLMLVYNYGGTIIMGDNCSLSSLSRIVSVKKVLIGNRVLIGHNVNILDNISHPIDAKLRHEDFINSYTGGMQQYDLKSEEIVIEDDVWIGFNSIILKGVKIGKGAIIGAGSVVTKDVRPWTVNVGNPLKCVRELCPVENLG